MTAVSNRQPQGIPTGGQFAAASRAEPDVRLAPPAQRKNQELHDAAAVLIQDGRTPEEANCAVALVMTHQMATGYLDSGKAALSSGHDTHAALLVIAHSAFRDLPSKIHEAGSDQEAARAALTGGRARLRSAGSLLDRVHPSGRQPAFRSADEVLARLEDFLTPEPAIEGHP